MRTNDWASVENSGEGPCRNSYYMDENYMFAGLQYIFHDLDKLKYTTVVVLGESSAGETTTGHTGSHDAALPRPFAIPLPRFGPLY